jgi:PTH2 family peptidyl-tRNA hydrolase
VEPENSVKQVIVVRKDLNMRKGKIAAQVAHASMSFLTTSMRGKSGHPIVIELTKEQRLWVDGSFTKVVVYVNSDDELLSVHRAAHDAGIESHRIQDSGRTEFNNVPTYTCVAIGPDLIQLIDTVTGHLPLL